MRKTLAVFVAALPVAALLVAGSGLAGAEAPPSPRTDKIEIKVVNGNLRFVGPKAVNRGDLLEIVNRTNPRSVGPHTFSLVTKASLPSRTPTRHGGEECFSPGHICLAIAAWHGVPSGKGAPKFNPAKAGAAGWSTMGTVTKKGDSWFTGNKPRTSFSQVVSANAGTTLYFVCAVHPWLQGSIKVQPAG